jgi:8-oxo-dGTP diphosphatase
MGYSGAILRNNKGKILFQLRDENGRNPNKWGIFGGGIKKGENPTNALIREIKEELGINISISKILKRYRIPWINYYIFEVHLKNKPKKSQLREGKDMKFMKIEEFMKIKNALWRVKIFLRLFKIN